MSNIVVGMEKGTSSRACSKEVIDKGTQSMDIENKDWWLQIRGKNRWKELVVMLLKRFGIRLRASLRGNP